MIKIRFSKCLQHELLYFDFFHKIKVKVKVKIFESKHDVFHFTRPFFVFIKILYYMQIYMSIAIISQKL